MKDGTIKCLAAIFAIVVLESIALCNGIDGVLLGTVIAVLAGLGGYSLKPEIDKQLKKLKK